MLLVDNSVVGGTSKGSRSGYMDFIAVLDENPSGCNVILEVERLRTNNDQYVILGILIVWIQLAVGRNCDPVC